MAEASRAKSRARGGATSRTGKTWDPAHVPPEGPSLADEEQRQFHATHFTADPRGAAMAGTAPGATRPKQRGGTPPATPALAARKSKPRPKRRGGAGPA